MRRLLLKLFRRRQMERDLETELAFHREMSAAGGNPIPLGNAGLIKEESYDLWRFTRLENLWRDLGYAARGLRRNPSLVASALLSLGLAIGVNTRLFSLGVSFLFSEPSVTDAASLVKLRLGGSSHASPRAVEFVRSAGIFQGVAGDRSEAFVNWKDGDETRRIFGTYVTKNYFTLLGLPIAHGRGILPGDPDEVAVLRHEFWVRHFRSDPSIVGRAIQLDGRAFTVAGVTPPGQRTLEGFGFSPDLYLPSYLPESELAMYARLRPGQSQPAALAALTAVGKRMDKEMPDRFNEYGRYCEAEPVGAARLWKNKNRRAVAYFFLMLLALVSLVLLIACVNVASLLLARASSRRREIAVSLALGAGRGRILQQLLAESLLLSAAGAAFGLVLTKLAAIALGQIALPMPVPIRLSAEPDWRVALYAAALMLTATIAAGLLPAWQASRQSLTEDFHREPRTRLRRALVVAQLAVTVVVLFIAFLFVRNLSRSHAISPGFDVSSTVRADVNLPPARYRAASQLQHFAAEAVRRFETLPGIESAASAHLLPFTDGNTRGAQLRFTGSNETVAVSYAWNAVSPRFFQAMSIPVLEGRPFDDAPAGAISPVAVNQTFVTRYLGGAPAPGRTFRLGDEDPKTYQIQAVVGDTKTMTIGEDPKPQMYMRLADTSRESPRLQFVLRSSVPPALQLAAVRKALAELEPAAGAEVTTLYSSIGLAFLPSQIGAVILGSLGLLGLLLAAIGLYGVMVYSVARRTREIGLRMAIGATGTHIARMLLGDSARLVAMGSGLGLAIAWFAAKPLAMFLVPGLDTRDPVSFAAVIAALAVTALLATWGPARRAIAVDPLKSLRAD